MQISYRFVSSLTLSIFCISVLILSTSCSRHQDTIGRVVTPSYQPENHMTNTASLREVTRVIVLPVHYYQGTQEYMSDINNIVFRSLTKQNLFACIPVLPADMREMFTQESFSSYEALPAHFFTALLQKYDADAILFTELTVFDPYKPISVGLRSSLVGMDGQMLWLFDDVFNSGQADVKYGALRYQEKFGQQRYPITDGYSALQSPNRFTSYAVNTMFSTIKL